MKTYILLVTLLIIIFCHWSSASNTGLEQTRRSVIISKLISRGLNNLWTWIKNRGETEDNIIGRCFGAARKLKFVMPMIVFKLGVIITTLVFLTIFSLKGLALLLTLVVMNTSGWAAKLALFKHGDGKTSSGQPSNVHFHVYQKKNGHYSAEPLSYDGGWEDKSDFVGDENYDSLSFRERLKRLNIDWNDRKF